MAADPNLITELRKLDDLMAKFTPAAHRSLQPPATAAELNALSQAVLGGKPVPEELKAWFGWHNGEKPTKDKSLWQDGFAPKLWFATSFTMLSAAEAADEWAEMKGVVEGGDMEREWKTTWVPLFYHGGGNYVVFETAPKDCGKILTWWHDDDLDTEAENLTELVRALQEMHSA